MDETSLVGREFASLEEAEIELRSYARNHNFTLVKHTAKSNVRFKCSRSGAPQIKKILPGKRTRNRKSVKCGCNFEIKLKRDETDLRCKVIRHSTEHTNGCCPSRMNNNMSTVHIAEYIDPEKLVGQKRKQPTPAIVVDHSPYNVLLNSVNNFFQIIIDKMSVSELSSLKNIQLQINERFEAEIARISSTTDFDRWVRVVAVPEYQKQRLLQLGQCAEVKTLSYSQTNSTIQVIFSPNHTSCTLVAHTSLDPTHGVKFSFDVMWEDKELISIHIPLDSVDSNPQDFLRCNEPEIAGLRDNLISRCPIGPSSIIVNTDILNDKAEISLDTFKSFLIAILAVRRTIQHDQYALSILNRIF